MNPQPIKYLTTCRHCPQQFNALSFGVPIIGQPIPERVVKFVSALGEHLVSKHKDLMQQLSGSIQDFTGLMLINQFESTDPGLNARADAIRADIHRRTRKHFITDAAITDLVARIGLDPEQEKAVAALMQGMRDAYEEKGEWSPEKQAQKILVTA